jgi:hypothetical protein
MREFESARTVFELIYSRWEHAPDVIIYDNACNLDVYCRKREPHFFRATIFMVDRLHYHSHHGCSPIYHMDSYIVLEDINSQAMEQFWSRLRFNTTRMGYLKQLNFMI